MLNSARAKTQSCLTPLELRKALDVSPLIRTTPFIPSRRGLIRFINCLITQVILGHFTVPEAFARPVNTIQWYVLYFFFSKLFL